jgi:hypothetical protein
MNPNATKSISDLTQKSVHTSDDIDIGDVEATNKETIVVKRGIINVHYYYITVSKVEGLDEHVVWLNITEQEVKDKYEKNIEPDPSKYYTKNQGYDKFDRKNIPVIPYIPNKGRKR